MSMSRLARTTRRSICVMSWTSSLCAMSLRRCCSASPIFSTIALRRWLNATRRQRKSTISRGRAISFIPSRSTRCNPSSTRSSLTDASSISVLKPVPSRSSTPSSPCSARATRSSSATDIRTRATSSSPCWLKSSVSTSSSW